MTFEEYKEIGEKYGLKLVQIHANVFGLGLPCFPDSDTICEFYTDGWSKSIMGYEYRLFCGGTRLCVRNAKAFITSITPKRFENRIKKAVKEIKELQMKYKEEQIKEDFQ